MRLDLGRRAQTDLDDIRDFSVAEFGVDRAIRYLDAIDHVFRRLVDHPRIGTERPELGKALRSYPVGEHRIYYLLGDDRIVIVRLLHHGMDAARHL